MSLPVSVYDLMRVVLPIDTNGDSELDEAELEALFQKEVSLSVCVYVFVCVFVSVVCLRVMLTAVQNVRSWCDTFGH